MSDSKAYTVIFKQLDLAARANLDDAGVRDYEVRKAGLVADGIAPDEVELILRGFIWDASEQPWIESE